MSTLSWQDIEQTIRTADAQKRHQVLRAVADLFLSNASNLDEEKVDLFDGVFEMILDDAERAEVVNVSEQMAPVVNAPRRLIKRLANNPEIEIAGPVLSQSPRLSEEDLCEISRSKGNSHLLAIAGRQRLSSPVTDILIDRGNRHVARKLVANLSAQLSPSGTKQLLRRAETDEVLGAGLCTREDIAPELISTKLEQASAKMHEVVHRMGAAQRRVLSLKQQGNLGDNEIVGFAKSGEHDELIAALALLSNLRADFVENMTRKGRLAGFVLLCKAVGLTWSSVDAALALVCSRNAIDGNEARQAHRDFISISRSTAERIVRFWCVRQSAQAAGQDG